jgi:3'-5' exoribonuclease
MNQPQLRVSEAPAPDTGKVLVRDLTDGQVVDAVFVVRDRSRRQKRNGEDFLKLQLGDVTGAVEAVVWDGVEAAWEAAEPGKVVRVGGLLSIDQRYGATLTVKTVRLAEPSEYDPADLLDGPMVSYDRMVADLRSLVATVRNPHLSELLQRVFGQDSPIWERWRQAPAAKHYHQAYRHGLLEHCLSVAQGVSAISATFPGIDRDVAVTGALLHDVGKIHAYALEGGAIEMTDAGRLQGEIPLGYYLVRRQIDEISGFPADLAQAILHIILSHHGKLEHGSPVTPCTREAALVHFIDNLGGTLGSFDRIEKTLHDGERWSNFDRALSGSAYFPGQAA